jgi:hypothetical protein
MTKVVRAMADTCAGKRWPPPPTPSRGSSLATDWAQAAAELQPGFDGPAAEFKAPVPTVFTKEGFRFFFYSNDHEPVHVHVRKGDGEAVFTMHGAVELQESAGLKLQEVRRALELAEAHRNAILNKWHEHFG